MTDTTAEYDGWQVALTDDFSMNGVAFVLRLRGGVSDFAEAITANGVRFMDDRSVTATPPALVLPNGAARALLDALADRFGGTGSAQQLRADLAGERERVNKLIDTVATLIERDPPS